MAFNFDVNSPTRGKRRSLGGSNKSTGLGTLLAFQLAQKDRQNIGQNVEDVKSQFGGNIPTGSTINVGKANIPLNRELNNDEVSAIAAERFFVPRAEDIKKLTQDGVFSAEMTKGIPLVENLERTYRQWSSGQPNALFTSFDPDLQEIQGKISSIRRYVFGEGGKQLTPYEAGIVNALIKPTGKSDAQYMTDLDEAIGLIREKSRLALGGQAAAESTGPNIPGIPRATTSSSQSPTDRKELIKQRFKARNP